MKKLLAGIWICLICLIWAGTSGASGILLPKKIELPPLAVKSLNVETIIENQIAETHVTQVFLNSTNRDLEATYIFPLPKGASVSGFTLYINGKPSEAELLERDKAASIYQGIVSRMRDPGILEYMGNNLFKARIFPVPANGEQKIEIRYNEIIPFSGNMAEYVYPLATGGSSFRTLEEFSVKVELKSKIPLSSVYSPSHSILTKRATDHEWNLEVSEKRGFLDQDFKLFFASSKEDIGLNVMTYKEKEEDGYFLLLLSPLEERKDSKPLPKDIIFVIDCSGSMKEDGKLVQAKKALKYGLDSLREEDRFAVIRFSTSVETFSDELQTASRERIDQVKTFVDSLKARGGTDIASALTRSLEMKQGNGRLSYVVFLTDGFPTIGVTNLEVIETGFRNKNSNKIRLFTFGVGEDVNTHLLDTLSQENGGVTTYVKPKDELEVKLSRFQDKIDYPVLSDAELHFGKGVKIYDMFPPQIGDLFAGEQVVVCGRFNGEGPVAIELKGKLGETGFSSIHETNFSKSSNDSEFIPRLWATRQIGYLLDQIRLHGETGELKEEVIQLSKEFNILTPYTAYIAVEDEELERVASRNDVVFDRFSGTSVPFYTDGIDLFEDRISVDFLPSSSLGMEKSGSLKSPFASSVGKKAVREARALRRFKEASQEMKNEYDLKYVKGIGFYLDSESFWKSEDFKKDEKTLKIKYGSPAYFELYETYSNIRPFLKLGEKVQFVVNGEQIEIGEKGKTVFRKNELKKLLK